MGQAITRGACYRAHSNAGGYIDIRVKAEEAEWVQGQVIGTSDGYESPEEILPGGKIRMRRRNFTFTPLAETGSDKGFRFIECTAVVAEKLTISWAVSQHFGSSERGTLTIDRDMRRSKDKTVQKAVTKLCGHDPKDCELVIERPEDGTE